MKNVKWIKKSMAMVLCGVLAVSMLSGCKDKETGTREKDKDTKVKVEEVEGWDASEESSIVDSAKLEEEYGPIPMDAIADNMTFGAVFPEASNEYWKIVAAGIESKSEELGIKTDIQFSLTTEDQAGQLAAAETLAKKDYDAYIFSPLTVDLLANLTDELKEKGKPVINPYFSPMENADVFVGALDANIAEMAAKKTIELLDGKGKVAVAMGAVATKLNQIRCGIYVDYIKENSDIEVVAELPAEWVPETAMQMTQDLLTTTPDVDLIWCANDNLALGVIEGVRSRNSLDTVKVLSMDATNAALKAVKEGEMYGTYSTNPFYIGELSVEAALRKVAGQDIARVISSPIELVDKDNVDEFLK